MVLALEINGTPFENFTSADVSFGLDQIAGQFSFEAVSEVPEDWPVRQGDAVRVLADGVAVLTGFVEVLRVRWDADSHAILARGRTRTGDLVDSRINALKFSPPLTMKQLVQNVLDELGIEDIEVIDNAGTIITPFTTDADAKAGQGAFTFLEQYARKLQVMLTTSPEGDIILTRNLNRDLGARLTNEVPDRNNNLLSAFLNLNDTQRFREYSVRSSGDASAFGGEAIGFDPVAAADVAGVATDEDVRSGRLMTLVAESTSDSDLCQKRAEWEGNIRRTRSQEYTCIVQGHEQSKGVPWEINQIVTVSDSFCDVKGSYLIDRISMNWSNKRGSRTSIRCVPTDSYLVQASQPEKQKKTNSFGDVFKLLGGE